tara:strand:- start:258 stop:407 length:150 start_codon:yes stop_codon:yes gene_type:complete
MADAAARVGMGRASVFNMTRQYPKLYCEKIKIAARKQRQQSYNQDQNPN